MKKIILFICLSSFGWMAHAQSKTTLALQEKHEESLNLYFYKNTLRMLNQQENKEFDQLIENIEKMKFLMIDKVAEKFGSDEYEKLVKDYRKEAFEPIVTSRMDGKSFDIYLRDAKGTKPGTIALVDDSTSLFVLDIVGTIDISKVGSLFSTIDGSTDIGKRIRNFANQKSDTVRGKSKKEKVN